MSTDFKCADCGRRAFGWVPVPREGRTVHWTPDLQEVKTGVYKCWPCRRELHPDMPSDYLEFESE